MNFASLMGMASQVMGLFQTAKGQFEHLKENLDAAKDTLSETELNQLQAKLEEIHQANMALSQDLDANLAKLQERE